MSDVAGFCAAVGRLAQGAIVRGSDNRTAHMAFVPLLVTTALLLSHVVMVNIGLATRLSHIYLMVGLLNLLLLPPLVVFMAEQGTAISLLIAVLLGHLLIVLAIRGAEQWRLYKSTP